mgnify:FL=1
MTSLEEAKAMLEPNAPHATEDEYKRVIKALVDEVYAAYQMGIDHVYDGRDRIFTYDEMIIARRAE